MSATPGIESVERPRHSGTVLLAAVFLAAFAGLSIASAWLESITGDEVAHLPAGYTYLVTGDFRMNTQHPPLIKAAAALPLLLFRLDPVRETEGWSEGNEWTFGRAFLMSNRIPLRWIVFLGRLPMIAVALLLGILLWLWARELWGEKVALGVLFLFTFSPDLLAHGHYVTTDVGVACFTMATLYALWKFCSALEDREPPPLTPGANDLPPALAGSTPEPEPVFPFHKPPENDSAGSTDFIATSNPPLTPGATDLPPALAGFTPEPEPVFLPLRTDLEPTSATAPVIASPRPLLWAIVASVALGLALLSKYSGVLTAFCAFALLTADALRRWWPRRAQRSAAFPRLHVAAAILMTVIPLIMISGAFGPPRGIANWITGFGKIYADFNPRWEGFLWGEYSADGFRSYYFLAQLWKEPIPLLMLFTAALFLIDWKRWERLRDASFLL
ncbi:MAG TPA: phospholipid carrier-dependent glycosyltransferase, partial [Thermoanaerobaculia bacterium]|nr:phospholipid carrier-dependent glycosyltransferase [Thermoanaerobaculia bacterium]